MNTTEDGLMQCVKHIQKFWKSKEFSKDTYKEKEIELYCQMFTSLAFILAECRNSSVISFLDNFKIFLQNEMQECGYDPNEL